MTVQFIEISGQKVAVLPLSEYERLVDAAEEQADVAAAIAAEQRRQSGEEYVPAEVVDRLLNGEAPLRVWRTYRGMTLEALAEAAGTHHSLLSRVETGKSQGKPALWRKLADVLGVLADDILPAS